MLTLVANGAQVKVDSKSKLNYIGVICAQKELAIAYPVSFCSPANKSFAFLISSKELAIAYPVLLSDPSLLPSHSKKLLEL